jgi:PRTRC genetic system ThiF family protein
VNTKTAKRFHYTDPYILSPQHPITIALIGAGGNGSQMLTQLARIDQAIKRLGHPGLYVTLFDDDKVSEANIGRQLFSPADTGMHKSVVLITRMNQFFGTSWKAVPQKYNNNAARADRYANIIITCVDSVQARLEINDMLLESLETNNYPYQRIVYWMDLGNSQSSGQFVIGSFGLVTQPRKSKTLDPVPKLFTVFEKFPAFKSQKTKDTGPSCSLAEALDKQDLFINSFLVQTAAATLWKMFRDGRINYHGAFINLQTLDIAPIYL